MRELRYKFSGRAEVKDFHFTQIIRCGHGYIYEVNTTGYDNEGNEIPIRPHYEVFKRKENERFQNVRYPRSIHFGKWAWTATSMKHAFEIFFSRIYPINKKT